MADEWNRPTHEIAKTAASELNQDDDDVPDDWEDEPEEEPEPPPKPAPKKATKPAEPEPDFSKMTEKEREQYKAEQEMKAYGYADMGGGEADAALFAALRSADEDNIRAATSELMKKVDAIVRIFTAHLSNHFRSSPLCQKRYCTISPSRRRLKYASRCSRETCVTYRQH